MPEIWAFQRAWHRDAIPQLRDHIGRFGRKRKQISQAPCSERAFIALPGLCQFYNSFRELGTRDLRAAFLATRAQARRALYAFTRCRDRVANFRGSNILGRVRAERPLPDFGFGRILPVVSLPASHARDWRWRRNIEDEIIAP